MELVERQAHRDKSDRPCRKAVGRSQEIPPALTQLVMVSDLDAHTLSEDHLLVAQRAV